VTPLDPDPFHILTVREGHEWSELHAFPNLDDLVAFLKKVKSPLAIRAYIFRGLRLRISKGPYRYLLDPRPWGPWKYHFKLELSGQQSEFGELFLCEVPGGSKRLSE
jgi:hypothetical protein